MVIEIEGNITDGRFIRRLNRFEALVEAEGEARLVHVPNTGRLRELLVEGAFVMLKKISNPLRKTQYSLYMVERDGIWVSIDSANMPNRIVNKALKEKCIANFGEYSDFKREVSVGDSRFDFALCKTEGPYYLEVKGVTLVEDNVAMFPDAPTVRGTRHLYELARLRNQGFGAGVIFIVQRCDAEYFRPNDKTDPDFGEALRKAKKAGIDLAAYRCEVQPRQIVLADEIPVVL